MDQLSTSSIPPFRDRRTYLWLFLATLFTLLATGRWSFAVAAWIAPVFAIRFMRTQRTWLGFLLTWLTTWLALAISWYQLQPMPLPVHVIMMGVTSLIGSLGLLVDRILFYRLRTEQGPRFASTFIFPTIYTFIEYMAGSVNPMGTFGAQAYSQYGNLVLMQLVSVTGLWGISFLIAWFAAIVNWAWEQGFSWPRIRRGVLAYGAVLLLVIAYGGGRLLLAPQADSTLDIASFTAADVKPEVLMPLTESDPAAFRQETQAIHEQYLARTITEAEAGAELVVWPELAGVGDSADVQDLVNRAQAIAREQGIYIAVPVLEVLENAQPAQNKLLVIDPAGEIVLEHMKYGGNQFEGTQPGDGVLKTTPTPFGTLAGIICWDADFPATVSQLGRQNTDVLLIPSHDWQAIADIHSQMAVFRGIENGVTIVRQADRGVSTVTDPYGRTLATADQFAGDQSMTLTIPTTGAFTLYPLIGDVFGWLAGLAFLGLLIWVLLASRRRSIALSPATGIKPEEVIE